MFRLMELLRVGDCYLNMRNVTHIELENEQRGLICTVYFNTQVTDREGANGIQSCKIFTGTAARDLKALLDRFAPG
jgi:hypothetical protein